LDHLQWVLLSVCYEVLLEMYKWIQNVESLVGICFQG